MTVTIYEGDCREYIPKVKADLIIMDPPYDIESNRGGGIRESKAEVLLRPRCPFRRSFRCRPQGLSVHDSQCLCVG